MSSTFGSRYLQKIASIVMSGVTLLAVIALGISWFEMTPAERSAAYGTIGRVIAGVGIVLLLPWATFFISTAAARRENNFIGVLLIAGYTVVDALVLALLLGVNRHSSFYLAAIVVGLLGAVVYNLLACDWIAEKR